MASNINLRIIIIVLAFLNVSYIGIEVIKNNIRVPFLTVGELPQAIYFKLERLNLVTSFLEFCIASCLICGISFVVYQQRGNIKLFIGGIVAILFVLIIASFLVSMFFNAPLGNLMQQFLSQIAILILFGFYVLLAPIFKKKTVVQS